MKCRTVLFNVVFTLPLILAGCAGMKTGNHWEKSGTDAQIEISYQRGSNSHRYLILEEKETAKLQAFKDQYLMKEINISQDKFVKIADDTAGVMTALKRNPAAKDDSPCRTPFQIRLKDNQENRYVEGCRGATEGAAVGKLIKDVEFLMASPKADGG